MLKLTSSRLGGLSGTLKNSPGTPIPMTLFNPESQTRLKEFGINPEQFGSYGADGGGSQGVQSFNSIDELNAAKLPKGTKVKVGNQTGVVS